MVNNVTHYMPGRIRTNEQGEPLRDRNGFMLREPSEPAPSLMDEEQVARFLGWDGDDGPKDVRLALWKYRKVDKLRGANIGKNVRYPLGEILRFVALVTEGASLEMKMKGRGK